MYSGVVRSITSRPFGNKTLHSFQLDSDRTYYNLGEHAPNFSEGQTVKFTGKPGTRAGSVTVDRGSVQAVEAGSVTPEQYTMTKQSTTGARRSNDFVDKDQYWKNREAKDEVTQKRIEIQAARNAAIAIMGPVKDLDALDPYFDQLNRTTSALLADNEARLNG